MPIVIDTYNVLQTTGVLPPELAGIDLESLLALLANSRYRNQKITLVCDGTSKGRKRISLAKTITLKFSGPHKNADDLIIELLDKCSHRRSITVVTSDRAVAKAAKSRRCSTLTSQLFLEHLANDAQSHNKARPASETRSHKPLDDKAVQQWIDEFELDESELQKPASKPLTKKESPTAPSNLTDSNAIHSMKKKKKRT